MIINAIKEISATITGFAQSFTSKIVTTDQLCVGTACVTQERFLEMIAATGGISSSVPLPPSSSPDTEAPTVTVSGSAAQTITVGDTWSDLGATATDNVGLVGDITAVLAGASSVVAGQVQIDTSLAATHTIIYSAHDDAGNIGTATRTVTVSAPTPAPSPVPALAE